MDIKEVARACQAPIYGQPAHDGATASYTHSAIFVPPVAYGEYVIEEEIRWVQ